MNALYRLLCKIETGAANACWTYKGFIDPGGYGVFFLDGKIMHASRAAYKLIVGVVPDNVVVCHSCDTPSCCNPAHLWLGTQADNVKDCASKGRAAGGWIGKYGENHPRYTAKLNANQVKEIRARHASGVVSSAQLGREFGVSDSAICVIVKRKVWKHV